MVDRAEIRRLAAAHINDLGLKGPPFDHEASLRAQDLKLIDDPLDVVLAGSNLPAEAWDKIDGVIDLEERVIGLKGGLHPHQYRFGLRHEVGHDVIPWQREMLHYCSIFSLPPELQRDFEREANIFAAETAFFASQFLERISSYPRDLRSVITLADEHVASYESTVRHYVECYPGPLLLFMAKKVEAADEQAPIFETTQYIRSEKTMVSVRPRQRFDGSELRSALEANGETMLVVDHELQPSGFHPTASLKAQSFWNGYKLFTLVWL